FDTCMEAFGKPAVIQPRPFVETDGIDHKGVSFPFRNRVPVPCRPEIFEVLARRQLASVGPDVSYPVFPLENLQDFVLGHDEFHRLVIIKKSRKTHRVAGVPWRVSDDSRLVNDASGHCRYSRRGQRRSWCAETVIELGHLPDAREIVGIEFLVYRIGLISRLELIFVALSIRDTG